MPTKKQDLWTKFENHLLNEGLSQKRIKTLKSRYQSVSRYLKLETASRDDIEEFVNKLNRNQIQKVRGGTPSGDTKQAWKKFLKQFFKWFKGHNEIYPKEVSWLKTRIPKNEKAEPKDILSLDEVNKLAQSFKRYDYKILTLLLFDSGFRISEMLSVKKKDLTWEAFDEGKKCFWIKCNESKTFERKIPVPIFTAELESFFNSSYFKAKDKDEQLFPIKYDRFITEMKAGAAELFKKVITPHTLRHSSCTHYAKTYSGNVPLLAQRFGWSFSARELQTYVRASGSYNIQGAKISYKNEIIKIKEENELLKQQVETLTKEMNSVKRMVNEYVGALQVGKP